MADTRQKKIFEHASGGASAKTSFSDIIAVGTIVDTNDPMQWGRVRILVPAWGDSMHHDLEGIPWAMYVTPFGGQTTVGTRGPGIDQTSGGVAYGMWAIPNVGAQAIVMSLDEDHTQRLFMGCVFDALTANTLPHGRWIFDDHPALDKTKPKSKPYGPYSGGDGLIQPLANNLQLAFGNKPDSLEWQTRAADYSASRVDVSYLQYTTSEVQDDKAVVGPNNWVSTQGYQTSRVDPNGSTGTVDKNYDSHTYSITTPGFHSIAMDDRMENCRMRFRTTSGHQILLDDTNERIYISTAKGNNWVEMDQAGNIDIFTTNKVNIRAAKDINLTSDQTIRMYAKEGIHMRCDKDIRIHSKDDINIKTDKNFRQHASKDTLIQTDNNYHLKVNADSSLYSGGTTNVSVGADLKMTSGKSTNVKAGTVIKQTAPDIYQNGPPAAVAAKAKDAKEQLAFYTNRIPAHEPWGRMMTKADTGIEGELVYTDKNVGKMERGVPIQRGIYWRR